MPGHASALPGYIIFLNSRCLSPAAAITAGISQRTEEGNGGTCHCDHIRLWICSGEFRDSSKEQQQFKVQRSEHLNSVCALGGGSWCRVGVGEAWMLVSGRRKSESWLFY